MLLKKNIKVGKLNLVFFLFVFALVKFSFSYAQLNENLEGSNINLKILDKISSKNELIKLNIGEEYFCSVSINGK